MIGGMSDGESKAAPPVLGYAPPVHHWRRHWWKLVLLLIMLAVGIQFGMPVYEYGSKRYHLYQLDRAIRAVQAVQHDPNAIVFTTDPAETVKLAKRETSRRGEWTYQDMKWSALAQHYARSGNTLLGLWNTAGFTGQVIGADGTPRLLHVGFGSGFSDDESKMMVQVASLCPPGSAAPLSIGRLQNIDVIADEDAFTVYAGTTDPADPGRVVFHIDSAGKRHELALRLGPTDDAIVTCDGWNEPNKVWISLDGHALSEAGPLPALALPGLQPRNSGRVGLAFTSDSTLCLISEAGETNIDWPIDATPAGASATPLVPIDWPTFSKRRNRINLPDRAPYFVEPHLGHFFLASDGNRLVGAGWPGPWMLLKKQEDRWVEVISNQPDAQRSQGQPHFVFSPDGRFLVDAGSTQTRVWSLEPFELLREGSHRSTDGAAVVSDRWVGRLFERTSDQPTKMYLLPVKTEAPSSNVRAPEISAHTRAAALIGKPDRLAVMDGERWQLIDVESGRVIREAKNDNWRWRPETLVASRDGNRVATMNDRFVYVWEPSGEAPRILRLALRTRMDGSRLAFSPDGRRLAIFTSSPDELRIWELGPP